MNHWYARLSRHQIALLLLLSRTRVGTVRWGCVPGSKRLVVTAHLLDVSCDVVFIYPCTRCNLREGNIKQLESSNLHQALPCIKEGPHRW